jgi:hypothetical protein
MKTTQAWGWLTAGVLALGLNGVYQDGGAAWASRAVNQVMARVSERTEGVIALAAGRADWFAAKAETVVARRETASCRWATTMARFQTKIARTQSGMERFEATPARQEALLARLEADRVRVEAQVVRMRMVSATFNPLVCPRVHVSVPHVWGSVPVVHVERVGAGPA